MKGFFPGQSKLVSIGVLCFLLSACVQKKTTYQSKVKKYGIVSSTCDIEFKSRKYLAEEIKANRKSYDTQWWIDEQIRRLPKGGIVYITIPIGGSQTFERYKDISYIVQTKDGKVLRTRTAQNTGEKRVYNAPTTVYTDYGSYRVSGPRGYTYDTLRINDTIPGAIDFILLEAKTKGKKRQRYQIFPDVK